jgi:hypothetical protein
MKENAFKKSYIVKKKTSKEQLAKIARYFNVCNKFLYNIYESR